MKTLENNVLLYDAECPLCKLYAGAFVEYGLLDANGRHDYTQLQEFSACSLVDKDKSRNEIALVDTQNQTVRYGLDSLLYILGHNFPALQPIFKNRWFVSTMRQVYNLVSYNRKVIAPAKDFNPNACIPDFSFFYRFIFIFIAFYTAAFAFFNYFGVYAVGFISIFWLMNVGLSYWKWKVWSIIYLGHLATLFLVSSLLLLPIYILNNYLVDYQLINWSIGAGLVALMAIQQSFKRLKVVKQEVQYMNTSIPSIV
jgi:predicted DCC family thiol-disulfide oxidoreductase YuxK